MFGFRKRNQVNELYAPIIGKCLSLEEVPDPMFANKVLGDGLAFAYEGDTVYAPCDGVILMVADTKHAVGIRTGNGMEILLHVGLDTVMLAGAGLQALVKQNDKIKAKDALIKIDRSIMRENKINLITPLIVTNTSEYDLHFIQTGQVDLNSVVLSAKRK